MKPLILIAEDEEDIRNTLHTILDLEGYEVVLASDGLQALKMLEEGLRPNLILLDLMMPVMDGEKFLAKKNLNSALDQIPVILISAVSKIDRFKTGIVELLNKPVDLSVLVDTVHRYCSAPANIQTHSLL